MILSLLNCSYAYRGNRLESGTYALNMLRHEGTVAIRYLVVLSNEGFKHALLRKYGNLYSNKCSFIFFSNCEFQHSEHSWLFVLNKMLFVSFVWRSKCESWKMESCLKAFSSHRVPFRDCLLL